MKHWMLVLAALLAVGLVVGGCGDTEDAGDGGATTTSATPTPAEPTDEEPAGDEGEATEGGETLVVTDPDGNELPLTTAGADETIATDLGIEPYPGATAYTVDVEAMPQEDIPADMGEISEDFTDLMAEIMTKTTLVYVTEDSFEDVQAWAEENFADWTMGEVEEENGMKNMEISSDQHESVKIAVGDTGDQRLILIGDESRAADAQAEMEQMMTEMFSGAMEAMEEAGEEAGAAMEEAGEAAEGALAEGADAVEEGAADVEAAVEDEGTQ